MIKNLDYFLNLIKYNKIATFINRMYPYLNIEIKEILSLIIEK